MLKIFKKIILTLGLMGLMTNNANAENAKFDFLLTPIADNVYSIISPSFGLPTPENKGWNSNSHFVVTEKGVLLFDTGSSELIGNAIKKAIESVTDKPVLWVVNSHSHADHWFGNAAFSDTVTDIDVEIITSNQALNTMKEDGPGAVEFYSRVTKGAIGSTQLLYPTLLLTQDTKRNFGGVDVEFIFANDGHSPGDVLMWLPKQKIIFGGDVLSSDWMPIITGHGNVPNLIDSLYVIAKLNPAIVLTGHGSATSVKSVIRDADLLSTVWNQVKVGFEKNKKPNEILLDVSAKLGQEYRPLYKDFDSEIERHVKLMYKLQQ
jgi:cyclase